MATMRGRKRTDDPTPNRARDIQRAFRARRAAHLQSLESRINDLEEENIYFRKLLSLPPANRPALGKGPTGRGVAKSRSRLNNDPFDKQYGSPEPPSDSSSTPPIDFATLSIPATSMEVYAPLGSADILPHNGQTRAIKAMNGHSPGPDFFSDGMLSPPMQHFAEAESNAPVLPFGYHNDGAWPINPDVPLPATADITPTTETARYYVYSAPADQQHVPQTVLPQPIAERPLNYGHRRSNTEPQSFGSVAVPFSPSHRSCASQSFVPIVGHELTPSPPPLPIRSNVQGFR